LNKKILITGSAGFIGFHLAKKLLENRNYNIVGIDNFDNYYSKTLKRKRNNLLLKCKNYKFYRTDIKNFKKLEKIFKTEKIDFVIHLAAQAGVRYSLVNPKKYIDTNINGFFNILENSKKYNIKHFIYASSSSVYGLNKIQPFKEKQKTDFPTSLYGATKKSNEIIAHSYSHIYNLPCTGLRFFTVYGPYGRPDMSLFLFTKAIFDKTKLKLFNKGNMKRSFTHIDDIVTGIKKIIFKIPKNNNEINITKKKVPYQIYNLGNPNEESLKNYLRYIEREIKAKTEVLKLGMQVGDVKSTKASMKKFEADFKIKFKKEIKVGIAEFVKWYKKYNKV